MVVSQNVQVVLSVEGMSSDWLAMGDSFADVAIVAFDSKNEILTIEKDGRQQRLRLVESYVRTSDTTAPAAPAIDRREAMAIARKLFQEKEGWASARLFVSQTSENDYQVLAVNESATSVQRRNLILDSSGAIKHCVLLPGQRSGGLPDVLFQSFSPAKGQRLFTWSSR